MTRRFTGPIGKSVQPWQAGAPLIARGRVLVQQCLDRMTFGGLKQFVASERLPDGSTIRALAINQGTGAPLIRVWVERPTGEPTFPFSKRDFIIENGWLEFFPRHIKLNSELISWYASDGDLVCDGSREHIYGPVKLNEDPVRCDGLIFLTWPEDEPANSAPSLAGAEKLQLTQLLLDRWPSAYSGLMRLMAQGMQAHRDIVTALATPTLSQVSPFFDGVVRDHVPPNPETDDPGRLAYWRVKVASAGVAMIPLSWPETLQTTANAVRTARIRDEDVSVEHRTRLEMVLLSQLSVAPDAVPIVVVEQSVHEALIGATGFAFLDGHPSFSPQPWGTGNESNPRCVLTDIRRRYDLGTAVNDPWEMATTLEYTFSFDEETGGPSCVVQKLYQNKWWPRGDSPYFYTHYDVNGRVYQPKLCQAFALSLSGCPSAEDAVIAAFYDWQGNLHTIEQTTGISTNTPPDHDARCLGLSLFGEENPNSTGNRKIYTSAHYSQHEWHIAQENIEALQISASDIDDRKLVATPSGSKIITSITQSNGYSPPLYNVYGSQIEECWKEHNWDAAFCADNDDAARLKSVAEGIEGGFSIQPYKEERYTMDGYESRVYTENFGTGKHIRIWRPGPSRDYVLCVQREYEQFTERKSWEWGVPEDGVGTYSYKKTALLLQGYIDEQDNQQYRRWEVEMEQKGGRVTSVFDPVGCYFRQKSDVGEGMWTGVGIPTYVPYEGRMYFEELKDYTIEGVTDISTYSGFLISGTASVDVTEDDAKTLFDLLSLPTTDTPCVPKPLMLLSGSAQGSFVALLPTGNKQEDSNYSPSTEGIFVGWS